MNSLAHQKQLLIAQAELHRALLQTECANVHAKIESLSQLRSKVGRHPWLIAGGTVAGLLFARRWGGMLKWAPTALAAWRWFNNLKSG